LQANFEKQEAKISADAIAMQRVCLNLIGNSIKFTPDGGSVNVSVGTSTGLAIVTVEDTGDGILAEEQPYLFQRFYQSSTGKHHNLGTGLGLYVCRQIVEAHMGKISCKSNDQVGITITIELPCLAS
jgi:signal transduction histidine kinase